MMFGIKKKTTAKFEVVAPVTGTCMQITDVQDQVFSKKMMGDGFAVKPDEDAHQVVAPTNGKVVALPDSMHAVGIETTVHGINVLVHIGLNTVNLNGQGFIAQVKLGDTVEAGTPVISFDPQVMREHQLDMTTMVIFTDGYKGEINIDHKVGQHVTVGTAILKQA